MYSVHCCRITVLEKIRSSLPQHVQAPSVDFSCGWLVPMASSNLMLLAVSEDAGVEGLLHSPHKVIMWPWASHSALLCLILLPYKMWIIIIIVNTKIRIV